MSPENVGLACLLTWRRPFSSRSPLSFTQTTSSSSRRTRSRGSATALPSSLASAIVTMQEVARYYTFLFGYGRVGRAAVGSSRGIGGNARQQEQAGQAGRALGDGRWALIFQQMAGRGTAHH